MIVTVEYDMIVVVKICSCVMGNYFVVLFLLSANKRYILLWRCSSAYKFALWVWCITLIVMRNEPLLEGYWEIICEIIVTAISAINQKMLINAAQKSQLLMFLLKKVFSKLKQNPWKMPVRYFSRELFDKFEGYRPAFLSSRSTKYELLQKFY